MRELASKKKLSEELISSLFVFWRQILKSMSQKRSPRRTKKTRAEDIDPSLLPPEMTHVGPHKPIVEYFESEEKDKIIEQWVDFYEKRPEQGARELIDVVLYIAGAKYELTEQQIKKQEFEKVEEDITSILEERTDKSEIQLFLEGKSQKPHDFWFDIGNGLIVCKGLYKDEFETFKLWVTKFCDSQIRPLRQASTVAVLSLTEFLADSIMKSKEGIDKLKKSKEKTALKDRQKSDFENEQKSAKELSMEFFTTVIKQRFNDVDNALRTVCINTTAKIIDICPDQFENGNFMKYIGTALTDENTKVKKEALKAAMGILENAGEDSTAVQAFFKRNISNIVCLCDDPDNGLVIPAFELLSNLADKDLMKDVEKTEVVFKLTADDATNVRNAAAKFFAKIFFSKKAKKGEQQELYETQIRKFAELCGDLSEDAIKNSVEAHWKYVKALQEFELMVQILISADDPEENAVFAHILCSCAEVASAKKAKSVKEMTTSIVGKFKGLYKKYEKVPNVVSSLIHASTFFDLDAIEKAAGARQMKDFLKTYHTLFEKSDDKSIYNLIIKSLSVWRKDKDTPSKIGKEINNEVESIIKEYSAPEKDKNKFEKLLALLEFVDVSGDKKLRKLLNETATAGDDELSALALECLEKIFKWDVMRIRGDDDECRDYTDTFNEFFTMASGKLQFDETIVREAAFKFASTIISLAQLIKQDRIDDADASIFFKQFHTLENKEELFDFLIRPLQCSAVDPKFSVHVLWYLQDSKLKPLARSFMTANSKMFPLRNGSELSELIRTEKYSTSHLKQAMKILAKKIEPSYVIDAWLDEPNDSLIPIYAPFLEALKSDDVYPMISRATGATKAILEKISKGKTLSQKDFVVKSEKKEKKSDSEEESSSEEESESKSSDDEEDDNDDADIESE